MPSVASIYGCLKRHHLIELRRRRKRRDEFRRWQRERPMQLWQMDIMGGVLLDDGTELKIVTGVDDHSRFCLQGARIAMPFSPFFTNRPRDFQRLNPATTVARPGAGGRSGAGC